MLQKAVTWKWPAAKRYAFCVRAVDASVILTIPVSLIVAVSVHLRVIFRDKALSAPQPATCDSILTDLQLSRQSPVFLSRSFFRLCPPPLSLLLSHSSLIHLSLLFLPLLPSFSFLFQVILTFILQAKFCFSPFSFLFFCLITLLPRVLFSYLTFFFPFQLHHFISHIVQMILPCFNCQFVSFPLHIKALYCCSLVPISLLLFSSLSLKSLQISPHLFHPQFLSGTLYPTRQRNERCGTLSKSLLKQTSNNAASNLGRDKQLSAITSLNLCAKATLISLIINNGGGDRGVCLCKFPHTVTSFVLNSQNSGVALENNVSPYFSPFDLLLFAPHHLFLTCFSLLECFLYSHLPPAIIKQKPEHSESVKKYWSQYVLNPFW